MIGQVEQEGPYKLLSDLYQKSQSEYPILNSLDIAYKVSPNRHDPQVETWRRGDPGTYGYPRPQGFPLSKVGVDVFKNDLRPQDLMGEVVSHDLVNSDPYFRGEYQKFIGSLQPWQTSKLQSQYDYAVKNFGETRPYREWAESSGLPAYFRGNLFEQWTGRDGAAITTEMYTTDQINQFRRIKNRIKKK